MKFNEMLMINKYKTNTLIWGSSGHRKTPHKKLNPGFGRVKAKQ
jgi:hypothetical protein